MNKTVKFGGSSLADAGQFRKVYDIIKSDNSRRYVVPSAPGKRFRNDIKITDMLYKCNEIAIGGGDFSTIWNLIKTRYDDIILDLGLAISLEEEYTEIERCIKARHGKDYAASRGEYLNGIILADFLGAEFVDAAELLKFDRNGKFLMDVSCELLRKRVADIERAVIPGFYGSVLAEAENGGADNNPYKIKTFSRGGSDVTGAIVAAAVKSEVYENWTDVSGFLVADPRIVKNSKIIDVITYKELRELSYMGATVLHEDSIFPVRSAGIPINIRNTNDVTAKGTFIIHDSEIDIDYGERNTITGIAGKKGFVNINIEKAMMNNEIGFCRKILQVLEDNGISIEHMPSGIDTMSLLVAKEAIEGREIIIETAIRDAVHPDQIEWEYDLALLAVVGHGMRRTRGVAGRIFSALSYRHINVKMIDQGSSELNIIIAIDSENFEDAVRAIYDIFMK